MRLCAGLLSLAPFGPPKDRAQPSIGGQGEHKSRQQGDVDRQGCQQADPDHEPAADCTSRQSDHLTPQAKVGADHGRIMTPAGPQAALIPALTSGEVARI